MTRPRDFCDRRPACASTEPPCVAHAFQANLSCMTAEWGTLAAAVCPLPYEPAWDMHASCMPQQSRALLLLSCVHGNGINGRNLPAPQ